MQLSATRGPQPAISTFSAVRRQGSAVEITDIHGVHHLVPLVWIRDNCLCDACRIVGTGEHRYFLGDAPNIPDANTVALLDDTLRVSWTDGHTTTMSASDLQTLMHIAERHHVQARPWADDFVPAQFDRDDILRDTATRIEFLKTAMRDGMAIVAAMPNESGECIRFLDELKLPVRETPFDRLHDVYFRNDGYNVAHTAEALPPHNDFASYTWPPSGQLIHMLANTAAGGQWVNVDGFRVISQLRQSDPDAIRTLARVPVAFREHSDTAESWTRAPIVRIDGQGNVVGLRFSNQLMQPMSPFDPEVQAFYEAYHLLARAIRSATNQIEIPALAGTMQFLHGHRILHARRSFDGTSGSRHLQDTYFDFDDVASLVALTTGDAR